MTRIHKLDGLRGLFALMVVYFHMLNYHTHPTNWKIMKSILPSFLDNFFINMSSHFVPFFFVLSGFVISHAYNDRIHHFKDFKIYIKNRFIRLYPLLFFSVGMVAIFVELIPHILITPTKGYLFPWQSLFDSLLFTNSIFILGDGFGLNGPSWSISAEMITYLFFGIFALWRKKWIPFFLILLIVYLIYRLSNNPLRWGFFGFFVGHLVYLISKKDFSLPNTLEWLIFPCLILAFYLLSLDVGIKYSLKHKLLNLFFGGCILCLLKTQGIVSKILESRLLQLLGVLSYSIYLNHALILRGLFEGEEGPRILSWAKKYNLPIDHPFFGFFLVLAITIFLILYSYLTYKYVEKKGGLLLRKWIS